MEKNEREYIEMVTRELIWKPTYKKERTKFKFILKKFANEIELFMTELKINVFHTNDLLDLCMMKISNDIKSIRDKYGKWFVRKFDPKWITDEKEQKEFDDFIDHYMNLVKLKELANPDWFDFISPLNKIASTEFKKPVKFYISDSQGMEHPFYIGYIGIEQIIIKRKIFPDLDCNIPSKIDQNQNETCKKRNGKK